MKNIIRHIHISNTIFFLVLILVLLPLEGRTQFGSVNFLTQTAYLGDFDVADLDNDGDLDVIMGAHSNFQDPNHRFLTWYENENNQWIPHAFDTNNNAPGIAQVVAKDFDNDGWVDIITSQGSGGPIRSYYYKNEGISGNSVFTKTPLNFVDAYKKMLNGDINGDGYEDLIVANEFKLSSIINQGTSASFSDNNLIANYEIFEFEFIDIELTDLDLDGDLDIIAAAQEKDNPDYYRSLFWYENEDGLGNFGERILIESETNCSDEIGDITCSSDIEIADFNSDGLPDIFYQKQGGEIYYQEANLIFSSTTLDNSLGLQYHTEYKAVDMDQDGDMDIVRCGVDAGQFVWARNIDGNGTFEQVLNWGYDFRQALSKGIIADMEGDGDLDCFFYSGNIGTGLLGVFALQNEGTGEIFSDPFQISDNINGDYQMFNIDMDEDGDEDLIYLAEQEGDIYWQENLGANGGFSIPIPLFQDNDITSFDLGDLDGDGDLDIAITWRNNTTAELYFYEKLDNSPTFGSKNLLLTSGASFKNLHLADMDADGDLDLVYTDSYAPNGVKWLENQGGLNFSNTHILIEDGDLISTADFNGDGFGDIFYTDENGRNAILIRESLNPGTTLVLSDSTEFFTHKIVDIDNDGDDDLVVQKRDFGISNKIFLYHNENGNFTQHVLAEGNTLEVNDVLDLDNDGKKDILYRYGWLRQQSNIFDYTNIEFDLQSIHGNLIHTANLDGVGSEDFIFQYAWHGLLWQSNQLANGFLTEGKVFIDYNENCDFETAQDTALYGWIIQFEKDSLTYFASTSPFGNYSGYLPDSGEYTVNVLRPSVYWGTCVEDTMISIIDTSIIYTIDFPILLEQECPLLGLDISSSRLRPCIPGMVTYSFCNYGTVTADAAQLEIQLDDWMLLDSTSIPWSNTTDSSYIFDLGDIDILECGQVNIFVTPDCQESAIGDQACFEGYITPDDICIPLDSLWDESTIEASAICDNDSIIFKLQNIGTGNMAEERQFRVEYIVNDDIVMLFIVDTFQLEVDEIKEIRIASNQDAFRIEADQDEEHPLANIATAIISNCQDMSGTSQDLINNFPNEDGNPFSETYCRVLTGSFDPNLKEAFPNGQFGAYIDNDWELEYNIHFQNTGNDTAFTVVIEDQISTYLDLSTLKIGAASHPFTWELKYNRELVFTFNDILLPDSTTNLPRSQGFVQFFISPNPGLPVLTNIDNSAAIFFDANDPIITDNVRRIIRKPVSLDSEHFEFCEGEYFDNILILSDTIIIDTTINNLTGCHLVFNHIEAFQTVFNIDTLLNVGDTFMGQVITQDTLFIEYGMDDNGCETVIYTQVSTPTNTHNVRETKEIKISPNPARDQIHIDWQEAIEQNARFEIRNINGQLIKNGKLQNSKIDTQDIHAGIYFIKIEFNSNSGIGKLILF